MPCKICNSLCFFNEHREILCPKCNNRDIINKEIIINDINSKIEQIRKNLDTELNKINLREFKENLLKQRENFAIKIQDNPEENHNLFKNWYVINLLKDRIDYLLKLNIKNSKKQINDFNLFFILLFFVSIKF